MFSLMYFSDDHLLEKDAFELECLFKLVVLKKFSWFSKHFWFTEFDFDGSYARGFLFDFFY